MAEENCESWQGVTHDYLFDVMFACKPEMIGSQFGDL